MRAFDSPTEILEQTEPLTAKQAALIPLLAAGVHINAAAAKIGIAESTAHRWMKLEPVQAALRKARQELFNEALEQLRDGVSSALDTLKRNMISEEAPAAVQVRAAQVWLAMAIELYRDDELERKLAVLEQYIKDSGLLEEEGL